jgi:hypothetical protein
MSRRPSAVSWAGPWLQRRAVAVTLLLGGWLMGPRRARAQVADLNDAINKAGRQRMLSQRMSLAWLAIGQGIDADRARRILDESMALFDRQFFELKAYAPTPEIRATYAALEPVWSEYKTALVGTTPGKAVGPAVVALGSRVLALAHQGTVQLERHSGKSVGRLVNMAGRQRMLSQMLAKLYFVQSWQLAAPEAARELDTARAEFLAALKTLQEAPEATPAIRQELALAQQQWFFFDNALRRRGEANNPASHASDVFRSSDNILQVMERVTGLYSRLPS